jgi:glutathione S-transferase
LIHGKLAVWESLAICEYLSEHSPSKKMWPKDKLARAKARSLAQEMHSGFVVLRNHMPMNLRGSHPGKGITKDVATDIDRIVAIWSDCRKQFKNKGPFLFGSFSIADAMFLPVVTRFRTYGVKTTKVIDNYRNTMLNLPAFKQWEAEGIKEVWRIDAAEIY